MAGLFQHYFSNKAVFYNLFNGAANNLIEMANLLVKAVNTDDDQQRETLFKQINKLESTGDDITHKIYLTLDKVIFTPLNRNAIYALAGAIDDVADTIQEAGGRMLIYGIEDFSEAIKQIAHLIAQAVVELQHTVKLLQIRKSHNQIIDSCRQVKEYEGQADRVYYNAIAGLFENEKDPITLIKYREILASLENSVNYCKSAASAIENISLNN